MCILNLPGGCKKWLISLMYATSAPGVSVPEGLCAGLQMHVGWMNKWTMRVDRWETNSSKRWIKKWSTCVCSLRCRCVRLYQKSSRGPDSLRTACSHIKPDGIMMAYSIDKMYIYPSPTWTPKGFCVPIIDWRCFWTQGTHNQLEYNFHSVPQISPTKLSKSDAREDRSYHYQM